MNMRLFCLYSHNQSLQQYANTALMESISTTILETKLCEDGLVFKTTRAGTLLRSTGFVVESNFQKIKELSEMGVHVICLDEDETSDFSEYDVLNPLIMISGPFHNYLSGAFLLRIVNEAIAACSKTRIKISLNFEFHFMDDGDQ